MSIQWHNSILCFIDLFYLKRLMYTLFDRRCLKQLITDTYRIDQPRPTRSPSFFPGGPHSPMCVLSQYLRLYLPDKKIKRYLVSIQSWCNVMRRLHVVIRRWSCSRPSDAASVSYNYSNIHEENRDLSCCVSMLFCKNRKNIFFAKNLSFAIRSFCLFWWLITSACFFLWGRPINPFWWFW